MSGWVKLIGLWEAVIAAFEAMTGDTADADDRGMYLALDTELRDWADDQKARLGHDTTAFEAAIAAYCAARRALQALLNGVAEVERHDAKLNAEEKVPDCFDYNHVVSLLGGEAAYARPRTNEETATILAALRFWQERGMAEPNNRSDDLHEIATNDGTLTSLDDDGIDELCEAINMGTIA